MDDRRFIEDYLPIQAISAEASRDKSVHIHKSVTKLDQGKRGPVDGRLEHANGSD